jgi:very-short-patch-repair endonuclease
MGPYIADFACHHCTLVIEVDGGQHGAQVERDYARTSRLRSEDYQVLRFRNKEVLSNIEGVLTEIQNAITTTPPLAPPHKGREKKKRRFAE